MSIDAKHDVHFEFGKTEEEALSKLRIHIANYSPQLQAMFQDAVNERSRNVRS